MSFSYAAAALAFSLSHSATGYQYYSKISGAVKSVYTSIYRLWVHMCVRVLICNSNIHIRISLCVYILTFCDAIIGRTDGAHSGTRALKVTHTHSHTHTLPITHTPPNSQQRRQRTLLPSSYFCGAPNNRDTGHEKPSITHTRWRSTSAHLRTLRISHTLGHLRAHQVGEIVC